jgi:hypothetical protein
MRERTDKVLRELVFRRSGPGVDNEAKAVALAWRRTTVCRDHEKARKMLSTIRHFSARRSGKLQKGDRALVRNPEYHCTKGSIDVAAGCVSFYG